MSFPCENMYKSRLTYILPIFFLEKSFSKKEKMLSKFHIQGAMINECDPFRFMDQKTYQHLRHSHINIYKTNSINFLYRT